MSSCLEFEGKVVEKAVQKASEALNIPTDKLQYNVVSYGSTGIFGLVGVKKAKICVTLPDEPISDKDLLPSASPPARERVKRDSGPLLSSSSAAAIQDEETVAALVEETFGEAETKDLKSIEGPLNHGKEILQRIIDFITTGAEISIQKQGDRVLFKVEGGNPGVLIGKRGQTLEAIQYLVEKVVNRNSDERIRIQIDVENYLDNRRANLQNLAKRLAEKVKATGRPSTISQMNAHDRRIVHLTLKDDNRVRTQSIGDGFYRKLVIIPKRRKRRSY